MMGKVNKLVVGAENVNKRARGREKPVVGIAATRCNISTFIFVICPMFDYDRRVTSEDDRV